jgi:DNA-directed RNA polymerase specialized sigma24 family protein
MTTHETDWALVNRACAGERAAFDEIYGRHQRALFGFLRIRSRSDDDAREVEQDVRIELWTHLKDYDPARGPFRAFAIHRAGFLLMRFYRGRGRRQRVEVLFSELAQRFDDLSRDGDLGDILDWLATAGAAADDEPASEPVPREALLGAVLSAPNPPHELVVFGLSKLVRMEDDSAVPHRRRPAVRLAHLGRTTPASIVARWSDTPLRDLAMRIEELYVQESELPAPVVRRCFEPLRARMDERVDETVRARDAERAGRGRERAIGDTTLRDYYSGSSPAADISHWWYAVQRRVLAGLQAHSGPSAGGPLGKPPRGPSARKRPPGRIPPVGGDHVL